MRDILVNNQYPIAKHFMPDVPRFQQYEKQEASTIVGASLWLLTLCYCVTLKTWQSVSKKAATMSFWKLPANDRAFSSIGATRESYLEGDW